VLEQMSLWLEQMSPLADVLVVGAGPVGLTAALALVRGGLRVDLVEARSALGSDSLAATFHPPTLQILADLGIDLVGHGLEARTIGYRDAAGGGVVRFHLSELASDTSYPYRRHVPQLEVCRLMLARLDDSPLSRIRFGIRADAHMTSEYPWVFASDGADSGLRSDAGIAFTGDEYAGTVIRLLCEPTGFEAWDPVTYVVAEDTSVSVLRMVDHIRVIVRVDDDQALSLAAATATATRVTGVNPVVRSWSQYRSQRRVVTANLVDNLILMGDSAHVTTTRGGMNMNAGIHDAAIIATALTRDPDSLMRVAGERLMVAREVLLPRTHDTLEEPSARLQRVQALQREPQARREFLRRGAMLDMVSWP